MKGIDVSRWQGSINWAQVKASGVDFVMIKAASGSNKGEYTADPNFKINIAGAHAAGLQIGVYLYSYGLSVSAVRGEAEFLINLLEPYRNKITFPVAYDLEDSSQIGIDRYTLSNMARTFCNVIRGAGYIPMLYANPNWLNNYVDLPDGVDLWLAHWGVNNPSRECAIWQHSDKGKVPGISGDVDMNIAYKEYANNSTPVITPEAPSVPNVSEWAKDAWQKAISKNIIDGSNPAGEVTREQTIVILDRLGLLDKKDDSPIEQNPAGEQTEETPQSLGNAFAVSLVDAMPDGREKELALMRLREVFLWCNLKFPSI